MKRLKLLVAFFSFCLAFSQSDKQLSFHQLTLDDGLSQNSVASIAQDSTGFMWFATQDGLNRYDGKRFEYFLLPQPPEDHNSLTLNNNWSPLENYKSVQQ